MASLYVQKTWEKIIFYTGNTLPTIPNFNLESNEKEHIRSSEEIQLHTCRNEAESRHSKPRKASLLRRCLFLRQEPQRHRLEAALFPLLLVHQKDVLTSSHALVNELLHNFVVMGDLF